MIELKISGENTASKVFIWEVWLQCQIAMHAFDRLNEYARVQVKRDFEATKPRPRRAIEVLADCSAFLAACAILSHCLYPAKKGLAARRGKRLRELMNIEHLPALRSLEVRNSFAHIDERLDQLLKENATDEIVQIHLARTPPTANLVLKRFNPSTLTISYLDQEANLALCAEEVRTIRAAALDLISRKRSEISLLGQAESPAKARDD